MKRTTRTWVRTGLRALACAAVGLGLLVPAVRAEEKPVTDEQRANIESALPDKAPATPAAPRKLLVFKLCKGFVHSSIPCGALAVDLMGKKTGAYEATISEDPAVFAPDSLRQYDAVLMLNTTGNLFEDAALRQSFLDFVKGGKGLAGIHAATDCFYEWPEYGEMIGGYFDGHPWGAGDTVGVKIEDPAHPVCEAFLGQGFMIKDEIYQFSEQPYSRDKVRVLLSLEPSKTDMTKKGMKRADNDYPIAWVKSYGDGRVFYCSLGHNESTYWNPAVLKHYLAGLQFALGDLPADTIPSSQINAEQLAAAQYDVMPRLLEKLVSEIAGLDYGQGAETLDALAQRVNTATPEEAAPLAAALATLIESEATPNAKQFAAEQLSLIGTEAQVPALAKLLGNPETAELGRYALERIPGAAATDALVAALANAAPPQKVGLINSLAQRHEAASLPALIPLVADADADVASAAARALARFDAPDAVAALSQAYGSAPEQVRPALAEALLQSADRLLAAGSRQEAAQVYTQLYAPTEPQGVRMAAFKGIVAALGERAAPLLVEVLKSDDEPIQRVAVEAAATVPGNAATGELTAALPGLAPSVQARLIGALGARGDTAALPAVVEVASSGADPAARVAALAALEQLGDASVVPLLANAAASDVKEDADAARRSLYRLKGADVDPKIIEGLGSDAPAATKVELVRALAERGATGATPALLKAVQSGDAALRSEAVDALGALAAAEDLPQLASLVASAPDAAAAEEAGDAFAEAAARTREPGQRAAAILAVLPSVQDDPAKTSALLRVLGKLGDDSALEPLRAAAASDNADVRAAAVRALAEWPTPKPVTDLAAIVQKAQDDTLRSVALRGYFRQLALPCDRPAADTLRMFEEGLKLAKTPEETKLALSGLGQVRDPRVLEVLKPYMDDPAYAAEAKAAAEGLQNIGLSATASHNTDGAKLALDGDPATRWTTNAGQAPGQWFQLDLGWERPVGKITLDSTQSGGDYPRGYEVYLSKDGNDWGQPVATGAGKDGEPVTVITFDAQPARFVKIVQTGTNEGLWWSIHELKVE